MAPRSAPPRLQPRALVIMLECRLCPAAPAPLAHQPPPLARPLHPRSVNIALAGHRTARRLAAAAAVAAAATSRAVATRSLAITPIVTAAVITARRSTVTRLAAPSAAARLATRRRTAAPPWCPIGIAQRAAQPLRPRTRGMHLPQRRRHRDALLPCAAVLEA